MKSRLLLATTLSLLGALCTSAAAQQVTTEMIGPMSGTFTMTYPNSPICPDSGQQDTITLTKNVHVSTTVDPTQNTVDYHINLLSVKGTGTLVAKYIGNGATDLLDQSFPGANITVPIQLSAKPLPKRPMSCRIPEHPGIPGCRNC
jgi:hypothetical protein